MASNGKKVLTRNLQTEATLTSLAFTWELHTGVGLEEFDAEKSLHNQARVGHPLDPGTVNRYVAALSNGDVFPAIVAAELKENDPYLIADGNHRFQAFKEAGKKAIDAYVIIGAPPSAVTMYTFEANTRHGLPTDEQSRIHQALYLMDNGVTAEDAARRLGLRVTVLRSTAALAVVDRRAEEVGLNPTQWKAQPLSVRQRLGQVSTDEGFAEMAKLTLAAQLRGEQVADAVNDMNKLRSSAKQTAYVKSLRATHQHALQTQGAALDRAPKGRQIRSGRQALGMLLGQVTVLPPTPDIVERMMPDERPEWIARTEAAIRRLTEVRDALKQ